MGMKDKIIYLLPVVTFFVGIFFAQQFGEQYSHDDAVKIYACGRAGGEVINNEVNEMACLIDGKVYEFGTKTPGETEAPQDSGSSTPEAVN